MLNIRNNYKNFIYEIKYSARQVMSSLMVQFLNTSCTFSRNLFFLCDYIITLGTECDSK